MMGLIHELQNCVASILSNICSDDPTFTFSENAYIDAYTYATISSIAFSLQIVQFILKKKFSVGQKGILVHINYCNEIHRISRYLPPTLEESVYTLNQRSHSQRNHPRRNVSCYAPPTQVQRCRYIGNEGWLRRNYHYGIVVIFLVQYITGDLLPVLARQVQ